jgi:hypothetical protein
MSRTLNSRIGESKISNPTLVRYKKVVFGATVIAYASYVSTQSSGDLRGHLMLLTDV